MYNGKGRMMYKIEKKGARIKAIKLKELSRVRSSLLRHIKQIQYSSSVHAVLRVGHGQPGHLIRVQLICYAIS
jgi:hypothetical protein